MPLMIHEQIRVRQFRDDRTRAFARRAGAVSGATEGSANENTFARANTSAVDPRESQHLAATGTLEGSIIKTVRSLRFTIVIEG